MDVESFALPLRDRAPEVQTFEPCCSKETLFCDPAAMLATVVLATLIVAAFRLPLIWTLALSGSVA
jgi:hypothetical protein